MCASDKEGLTQFVEGAQVPVLSGVTHEVIPYDPEAGFERFRTGSGRTVELFLPLLLAAIMALLVEGWLANPRRSPVSDIVPVQDVQGARPRGPAVDRGEQVTAEGRVG